MVIEVVVSIVIKSLSTLAKWLPIPSSPVRLPYNVRAWLLTVRVCLLLWLNWTTLLRLCTLLSTIPLSLLVVLWTVGLRPCMLAVKNCGIRTLTIRRVVTNVSVTYGSRAVVITAQTTAEAIVTVIGSTARVKKTLSSLILAASTVTRPFPFPFVSPVGVSSCNVVNVPEWKSVSRRNVIPRPRHRLTHWATLCRRV